MGIRAFFLHRWSERITHRSPLRAIVAGFLFVSLTGPRWGFAQTIDVHGDYRITIDAIPAPTATPNPTPVPSASASPSAAPSKTPTATPPVSPTPSGSPAGAVGSSMTRPTLIEHMTETSPGVWRSNNIAADHAAVLQFRLSHPVAPGALLRVTYWIASNVHLDNSRNIKFGVRDWLGQIGNQVLNDYVCTQKGGNPEFVSEQLTYVTSKVDPVTNLHLPWTRAYFSWPQFTNVPRIEVHEYRYASAVGKADGAVRFTADGQTVFTADHWQSDDAGHPGTRDIVCIQMVYAPISGDAGPLPANSYVEFSRVSVEILP